MFRTARSWEDLIKVFIVRGIVFVEEQAAPYAEEIDDHELESLHILGEIAGEPAAVGRIRFLEDAAKLERIAIRKAYRGRGLGHSLVDFMIRTAHDHGFGLTKMHAQVHLRKFYEEHGFEVQGDVFMEAGIEHYLMIRDRRETH